MAIESWIANAPPLILLGKADMLGLLVFSENRACRLKIEGVTEPAHLVGK